MTKVNITLALALVLGACVKDPSKPVGEKESQPIVQTETTPENPPETVEVPIEGEISVKPKQKIEKIVENIYGGKFSACEKYESDIESAVKTYWGTYQYPKAWMAQIYQESLCKTGQTSHAGAEGLAQFMPPTWSDMEKKFGITADPHDDIAIEWGAYYMARLMAKWKARRPMHERWRLGLASYNAGFGNILEAQKECDNEPFWGSVKLCLKQETGENARETKQYVTRIERWWLQLSAAKPWEISRNLWSEVVGKKFEKTADTFEVTRCFSGHAWGTYWRLWDGWITADHVYIEHQAKRPQFAEHDAIRRSGMLDTVFFGHSLPVDRPARPEMDEPIYVLGYPAASDKLGIRLATARMKRRVTADDSYAIPTYVATIENRPNGQFGYGTFYEPVIGGMSGGLILSVEGKPLGVLVGESGKADFTGDGIDEYFLDFVALADFYDYVQCTSSDMEDAELDKCAEAVNYELSYRDVSPNHKLFEDFSYPMVNEANTSIEDKFDCFPGGL